MQRKRLIYCIGLSIMAYQPIDLVATSYVQQIQNLTTTAREFFADHSKKVMGALALSGAALSCYYLYQKYKNTNQRCSIPSDLGDNADKIDLEIVKRQPTQEDKIVYAEVDVSIYKFNNGWRDVGDIRREFEDKDNFDLLAGGFSPPANPNVDVEEQEDRDVYDIRNVLLPPGPLIYASRTQMATDRSGDAGKYGTGLDKMVYIMRKNSDNRDFVGFIVFYQEPYDKSKGYIEIFLISKLFRGKKISNSEDSYASLLMNRALEVLKDRGVSKVELATRKNNDRARNFYERKMGFKERSLQDLRYPNEIFYEKDI